MNHVYPLDEEAKHILEGTTCPCGVQVDWEYGIVIHNAFDHRQVIEEAEEIIRCVNGETM